MLCFICTWIGGKSLVSIFVSDWGCCIQEGNDEAAVIYTFGDSGIAAVKNQNIVEIMHRSWVGVKWCC
jgi:hypothetical protein